MARHNKQWPTIVPVITYKFRRGYLSQSHPWTSYRTSIEIKFASRTIVQMFRFLTFVVPKLTTDAAIALYV